MYVILVRHLVHIEVAFEDSFLEMIGLPWLLGHFFDRLLRNGGSYSPCLLYACRGGGRSCRPLGHRGRSLCTVPDLFRPIESFSCDEHTDVSIPPLQTRGNTWDETSRVEKDRPRPLTDGARPKVMEDLPLTLPTPAPPRAAVLAPKLTRLANEDDDGEPE